MRLRPKLYALWQPRRQQSAGRQTAAGLTVCLSCLFRRGGCSDHVKARDPLLYKRMRSEYSFSLAGGVRTALGHGGVEGIAKAAGREIVEASHASMVGR